jgi:hypothetical protein
MRFFIFCNPTKAGHAMMAIVLPRILGHIIFVSLRQYNDKQNRVLLVIVFIQKVIAYSCVNKIQICKHESCSIQHIEPCEKKI